MRPKCLCASPTAASTCFASCTSSARGSTLSPYCSTSGASCWVSRAVAASRSPCASTSSAKARPSPREEPVISQTRWFAILIRFLSRGFSHFFKALPVAERCQRVQNCTMKPEELPGLRERKRAALKKRLIDTAIDLFLERGYQETRIEDITTAADVSRRTFFHYFSAKDDVVTGRFAQQA